jgi:hypothetical protein
MNIKGHLSTSILIYSSIPLVLLHSNIKNPTLISIANDLILPNYYYIGISHISTLITALIHLFIFILGVRTPDLDLYFKYLYQKGNRQQYRYHRQITHSLLLYTILLYISIHFNNSYLLFYIIGVFTHLIADMLTGSIPILFWGAYYSYFSRIGITTIIPKPLSSTISKYIVKLADKYHIVIYILAILLYLTLIL